MSNQEAKNQEETNKEAGVEKRRRFIKGAGIAAPVVLTLSSPSVFGIQCGSEIISGNESQNAAGGSCTIGYSPVTWKTRSPWPSPYTKSTSCSAPNGSYWNDTNAFSSTIGITGTDIRTMKAILCSTDPADRLKKDFIAALLNAALSPITYPMNVLDVKAIQAGIAVIPTDLLEKPANPLHVAAYFETTW